MDGNRASTSKQQEPETEATTGIELEHGRELNHLLIGNKLLNQSTYIFEEVSEIVAAKLERVLKNLPQEELEQIGRVQDALSEIRSHMDAGYAARAKVKAHLADYSTEKEFIFSQELVEETRGRLEDLKRSNSLGPVSGRGE